MLWSADSPNNITYSGGGRTYTSLFDPATGTASLVNMANTGHDGFCSGTAILPDGRVMMNGGDNAAQTSVYDPATDTWSPAAKMNYPRAYNASTPLADGSVLTFGGSWGGGLANPQKPAELFTVGGGWKSLPGIATSDSDFLTADKNGAFRSDNHMWLIPTANGKVLHAGPSRQMHWLDVSGNGSYTAAGPRADDTDSMNGNAAMYDAGKILTVGGSPNYDADFSKTGAFVIDTTRGIANARRISGMAYPRMFGNSVVLPNGQVVVMGGQTYERAFTDDNSVLVPELFDPQSETFTALPAMSVARNYHSIGLLMLDGRVVSGGGGLCNCAGDHANLQILSPPYLFNEDGSAATRPVITTAPAKVGYGDNVTVNTDSAITSFAMVRLGATTHTVNNDQRRIPLTFTAASSNSYRVAVPSNPGLLLPGQWMLFAMNAQGTPSVAKVVTVSHVGAPVLTNPGMVLAVVGRAVNIPIAATSASGTLSYSAINLPAGLSISSSGVISGTPTAGSNGVVTVSVSNGTQTVSTDVSLSVTSPQGSGTGLQAQYFASLNFAGTATAKVESPNINWPTTAAALSVRWTGFMEAGATGAAQLQAVSAQGARVWFDNQLVIDTISNPAPTTDTASVIVMGDQRYAVLVEYAKPSGAGSISLNWKPAGATSLVPVPADRLYPSASPALINLAAGKTATQSSTDFGGAAGLAVDGNTNGAFAGGSVTHSAAAATQDWWQVDLGQPSRIDLVQLWNRTDCCTDRLQNFVVLVSPTDMTGRTLDQLLADPAVLNRRIGKSTAAPLLDVPVNGSGRYVRVQAQSYSYVSLAEVLVLGAAGNPPVVSAIGNRQSAVGVAINLGVTATDPNNSVLTYSASGLPTGTSINATSGVISGTPSAPGSFAVTLTVTNSAALSASTSFSWTVLDAAPQVVSLPAPVAASGSTVSYSPTLSAGAAAQYSWNFGDGSAATALSSSALASHAFAAPGVYTVTLTITTADGRSSTQQFLQAIYPAGASALARASTSVMFEPRSGASSRIWVVNPDNDSVSVFDATSYAKLAEIAVGSGPRAIAQASNGAVWVTNRDGASLTVIDSPTLTVAATFTMPRGSQPYGVVGAPTDGAIYVSFEGNGQITRFSPNGSVTLSAGSNPRHLALSASGDRLLVSRFITRPLPGEGTATVSTTDASGNKLGGEVLVVNTATMSVTNTIVLAHSEKVDAENQGRGIPNYLGAAAISPDGKSAWVPSKQDNIKRGSLRDGQTLNFQNTVRSISSRIDLGTLAEDYASRVDHDNAGLASAAVYHPTGAYLFVALETNRQVAVLDAAGKRELFRFDVGLAPQGLAVAPDGLKLYVNNFMGRSVSVIDLTPLVSFGQTRAPALATLSTVATDKLAASVLRGKQLFYDAKDTRLARDSYMSCASCHNNAGLDGRTWDFTSLGEGLRNTTALNGRAGTGHGFLHWSANFDEVQDFEAQIRTLAGGTGLMADADFNAGTRNQPLGDKKAGLSADLDALTAYLGSLTTFAPSPLRNADGTLTAAALAGKTVFQSANCASCHSGAGFTGSGEASLLKNIGTVKASSGKRLGGTLSGIDVPTLRDVWATAPYLHDGSAAGLAEAIKAHNNVSLSTTDLANVADYVRQIGSDETSSPVPTSGTVTLPQGSIACAAESATCVLPTNAVATVYYGANGTYVSRSNVSGSAVCSAAVFSEPGTTGTRSCSYVITSWGTATGSGLLGQYFANTSLSGSVALQRTEALDFNWGAGSPGSPVASDGFSARWIGTLEAPAAGAAQLSTQSDEGVRVWFDSKLVIDNWVAHTSASNTANVTLVAGNRHAIMVEYYEGTGSANLQLSWKLPGATAATVVPANRLYAGAAPSTTNLAAGKAAKQSSTGFGGDPWRAVDGNTNGNWGNNSVTHTNSEAQAWWQVDLGAVSRVDLIQLWNRADCCQDRLQNFVVFVSPNDMTGKTLAQLQADTTVINRSVGATLAAPSIGIPVNGAGRYVRVQLTGTNYLSLTEVQVFGDTPTISADCSAKRSSAGADVFLLIGQSNMSGWGNGYDASLDGTQAARIQQWSRANTVIAASEPLQHADWQSGAVRVGMGTSFARSYLATLPTARSVLLVPAAYGGTGFLHGTGPWNPGQNLFEDATARLTAALTSNSGNCVAGILWHQGEADVVNNETAATYQSNLDNMILTLRSRVPRSATAPFILGQFTPTWTAQWSQQAPLQAILGVINDTPRRIPYTAVAPSAGLAVNDPSGDYIHFNAAGQRAYGTRYFQALPTALGNSR